MEIPLDALAGFAIAALLAAGAFLAQIQRQRKEIAGLKEQRRPIQPVVMAAPGVPEPPPHAHVWEKKHSAERAQWRIYRCTVPGCKNVDCRTGNA